MREQINSAMTAFNETVSKIDDMPSSDDRVHKKFMLEKARDMLIFADKKEKEGKSIQALIFRVRELLTEIAK